MPLAPTTRESVWLEEQYNLCEEKKPFRVQLAKTPLSEEEKEQVVHDMC